MTQGVGRHGRGGGATLADRRKRLFSDHADPPELLKWLHTFRNRPSTTYLVHGEPVASSQLRDLMKRNLGWNVEVAQYLEKVAVE